MPQQNHNGESEVNILGQSFSYPAKWTAVASVFFVCLTACALTWIVLVKAKPENIGKLKEILTVYRLDKDGVAEVDTDKVRFGFWTPSQKTWEKDTPSENDRWEANVSAARLDDFASKLRSTGKTSGFRRYDVYGQGRGKLKPGIWWIVTADKSFSTDQFNTIYREFWNNPDAMYLEVTGEEKR